MNPILKSPQEYAALLVTCGLSIFQIVRDLEEYYAVPREWTDAVLLEYLRLTNTDETA